jgi:hypothetical protein
MTVPTTAYILSRAAESGIGKKYNAGYLILEATANADKLTAEVEKIRSDKRLNDDAKASDIKALVTANARKIGKLQAQLADEWKALDAKRAALAPTFPNVSENMQLALAAALRNMSGADHAKLLASDDVDDRILASVFGLPSMLTGVAPGLTDSIRQKVIERTCADKIAELTDEEAAVHLAKDAVQVATDSTIALSGHAAPTAAKQWLESHFE